MTHEEIKRLFLNGEIDLLLCTDAAAEGLNLQTADLLINFDLGWNPMKVEQRIGRIDRIGQKYADIEVLNMCYLGSTEEIVYGRLLERLQAANLVVGTQQISMLPVEPEEFRDLQNGSLSEEELARRSEQRLRRQKAAIAAMEISANDQYEMYNRLSAKAKRLSYPATTEDLWDAFVASSYLASKGATVSKDGVWYLPGSEEFCELRVTNQRDAITDKVSYLSWGNSVVDDLLASICSKIPNSGPIQRISVQNGNMEMVGYLVASTGGAKLVMSISDVNGLHIEPEQNLSKESILSAKQELEKMFTGDEQQVSLAERAEKENQEYACLQKS